MRKRTIHYCQYGWTHTKCGLRCINVTVSTRRESTNCIQCLG